MARRAAGEPLEQVLGWADFCGLRIAVDPAVFVPRRRTQFLIRQAAPPVRPAYVPAAVVDMLRLRRGGWMLASVPAVCGVRRSISERRSLTAARPASLRQVP